jgi:hypothetical protein
MRPSQETLHRAVHARTIKSVYIDMEMAIVRIDDGIEKHELVKQCGRNAWSKSKGEVRALVEGSELNEDVCPVTMQRN